MQKQKAAPTRPSVGTRMLTRAQAAELLNISCATLARWAGERDQGPPFVKLATGKGGSVRYPSDLLEEFIASRVRRPK
jgi:hypothetical protein